MSDAELMRRVRHGDIDALGQLYDRYSGAAYALARALCRRTEVAEAVVEQSFLSIWRNRSRFPPMGNGARVLVCRHAIDVAVSAEDSRGDALSRIHADQRDAIVLALYGHLT
jgi:RNA polymerase sigma-70 factor (ECF subfamily)